MPHYALIKNSYVENVIVADEDFVNSIRYLYEDIIETSQYFPRPNIGWTWDEVNGFRNPLDEPIVITVNRLISVGSFYDRFGSLKWQILSDQSPLVQALVKDASVRRYIDLNSPDLLAALNLVRNVGYDIDLDKFINSPILESERV